MNQQQLESKARQRLRRSVICKACRRVWGYTGKETKVKAIDDYLREVVNECPHCQHHDHVAWLNTSLEKLRDELNAKPNDRHIRRRFEHEFKKFQGKMSNAIRNG